MYEETELVIYLGNGERKVIGRAVYTEDERGVGVEAIVTDPNYISLVDDGTDSNYSIGPMNADISSVS